jgi:hypothetical protein
MRAIFAFFVLLAFSAAGTYAQSQLPRAGTFGVTGSFSNAYNTVGGIYQLSDNVALVSQVGFYSLNIADTASGSTTDYPDTFWEANADVLFRVARFASLLVDLGPAVAYEGEAYSPEGNSDNYGFTYLSGRLVLRLTAMINKNFGIYGETYAYYLWYDDIDHTASFDSLHSGYGVETPQLGGIFYLW